MTGLPWGEGRMIFHARREEIMQRIEAGEPAVRIWRDLSPPMAYRTFVRHVTKARKIHGAVVPEVRSPVEASRATKDGLATKAAPGSLASLSSKPIYEPRRNTMEELFGEGSSDDT